jgi:hypothetical protein
MKAHIILSNGDIITNEFLTTIFPDKNGKYKTYTKKEVEKLTVVE